MGSTAAPPAPLPAAGWAQLEPDVVQLIVRQLLPHTALPVLVLGAVALLGSLLAVLSCGLALVWLAPCWGLTLGAAWRQLAGLQRTWGDEPPALE